MSGSASRLTDVVVDLMQFSWLLDWGPHFHSSCWLAAVLGLLLCGPLLRAAHNQLSQLSWLPQSEQVRLQERISSVEIMVFYKLTLNMTFHHFSLFYSIRNNSLTGFSPQFKGRGLHEDINSRKWILLVINKVTCYTQNKENI